MDFWHSTGKKRLLALILGLSLVLSPAALAEEHRNAVTEDAHEAVGDQETLTEAVQESTMLVQLKQKLAQAQYRYHLLKENVETARESLIEIRRVISNLETAIVDLEAQITDTDKKILSVKSQTEVQKMELAQLEEDAQILELQFEDQKEVVSELMALLYMQRGIYYGDEGINTVKMLASPDSVSETLQNLTYLDLIEAENQVQIDKMSAMADELALRWVEIREKRLELEALDAQLHEERAQQVAEKEAQEAVLAETLVEQKILETMMASAGDREEDLLKEIEIYEENVALLESQMAGTRVLLSSEEEDLIARIEEEMAAQFNVREASDFVELGAPLAGTLEVTALFHDGSYRSLFGVDHYALDLRARQGTPILAPADGMVVDVVFDPHSSRYAYVMVAHRKGVMTLFGHVSQVAVSVGDPVLREQVIGFTGGTPGGIGTGGRSTGPHLHFEVWQDGVRVDPLLYLPLDAFNIDTLPENYAAELRHDLENEIRQLEEELTL